MKNILTVIPLNDSQKTLLQDAAGSNATITFREAGTVTKEDLEGAHGIIGMPAPDMVKQAANLAWLQLFTAGVDPFVVPGVMPDKAVLTNAPGAHALSVAEHAVALTFALLRKLRTYGIQQQAAHWELRGEVKSVEGARIAVLGLGESGGLYAKKMHALGAHILGVRRHALIKPEYVDEQFTNDALDEVLGQADVVTMVLPGGAATEHIMDERRLRLMKKDAYLINVGRGNAIDPKALKKVLAEGHLAGVALDVTEPEPLPSDDALWGIERVLITPHSASNFLLPGTKDRAVQTAAENIKRFLAGEALTEVVDRSLGY